MRNIRYMRKVVLAVADYLAVGLALMLSRYLVWEVHSVSGQYELIIGSMFPLFAVLVLSLARVYRVRLVESSLNLMIRIFISDCCCTVALGLLCCFTGSFSLRFLISVLIVSFFFTIGYRVLYRIIYNRRLSQDPVVVPQKAAVVYGTGELGLALARQYKRGRLEYRIVGYVDDDPACQGTLLQNIPVLGTCDDIEKVINSTGARFLIIAITSLSAEKMQNALEAAKKAGAEALIIPSLFEVKSDKSVETGDISLRGVNLEDLLGRRLIEIDKAPIEAMVKGKIVLVTGAGGSIGSEICRQLLSFGPKRLLLLDIDETELHDLSLRLHDYKAEFSRGIFPICCDIKNSAKIDKVFESFRPEIVFHAAAYKHVPMMEYYPEEAIRTNIAGSYNVLSSAVKHSAEKVIVISTDKAVNPTNVMGATKRFVELEASLLNNAKTEIVCVRFGNVLGSRGSMLPLFLEQIRAGRPITVTHKDIIRYFMAIPEAVSLVFLAGAMAKGGEVMVLDMGQPVRIYDFAEKLVKLFGDGRSQVVVTGLRPGEKLYEELLANKDLTIPTENDKVFKARVTGSLDKAWLEEKLATIEVDDAAELVANLQSAIPEFRYQGKPPLADLFNE